MMRIVASQAGLAQRVLASGRHHHLEARVAQDRGENDLVVDVIVHQQHQVTHGVPSSCFLIPCGGRERGGSGAAGLDEPLRHILRQRPEMLEAFVRSPASWCGGGAESVAVRPGDGPGAQPRHRTPPRFSPWDDLLGSLSS